MQGGIGKRAGFSVLMEWQTSSSAVALWDTQHDIDGSYKSRYPFLGGHAAGADRALVNEDICCPSNRAIPDH